MVCNKKINPINWSAHEMMVLITSACGEGSDEPACTHDLARAFTSCINKEDSEQLLDILSLWTRQNKRL